MLCVKSPAFIYLLVTNTVIFCDTGGEGFNVEIVRETQFSHNTVLQTLMEVLAQLLLKILIQILLNFVTAIDSS